MNKSCPKCYKKFECKAEKITTCHCTNFSFSKMENQAIAKMYSGCLCSYCLTEIRTNFDKPARIYISFQDGHYDEDLYLLAKENTKLNSHGNEIELHEGKLVKVYEYDEDENNFRDDLIACGTVTKNLSNHKNSNYKWSIQLDNNGIRFESEIQIIELVEKWQIFANKYVKTERYIYEWQNDIDCRRLIAELLEKFPYLTNDKYTYKLELQKLDEIVINNTFEVNECIWKSNDYNREKHWYYYRMNELIFENERECFTKKK